MAYSKKNRSSKNRSSRKKGGVPSTRRASTRSAPKRSAHITPRQKFTGIDLTELPTIDDINTIALADEPPAGHEAKDHEFTIFTIDDKIVVLKYFRKRLEYARITRSKAKIIVTRIELINHFLKYLYDRKETGEPFSQELEIE